MDYLRLAIALVLPWLSGYLWLAAIESRFSGEKADTCRQAGYGFFLGYAALQGIVLASNSLFGGVTFMPVISAMTLITLAGGALYANECRQSGQGLQVRTEVAKTRPIARRLFWLFTGWAILHLVFVAIEILHVPVFPWDAWLTWMYRAKAWFYSGQIFVLDHPADWLHGTGDAAFNVVGSHYPTFVPVLALWVVTALGYWSETLVNLPTLFCGIALGLALYGECREYGVARWQSALAAWLLLSIPLVGAHLSLAGQADIWMAGFTGLGFVALVAGLTRKIPWYLVLGLCMTAMGIATKVEGVVWLLAYMLTLALVLQSRLTLVVLSATAALLGIGWMMGIAHVELPLLGTMGIVEGRLHIPLLGSYALQSFDLWDDYWSNFFESGTWHLLWTLVILAAVSLLILPVGRLRRTLITFYGVLLCAQLFIFEGTELGQWADDWTAINRLPLHFAPALVFSLVILSQSFLAPTKTTAVRHFWWVPALGLAITLAGAGAYLSIAYPGGDGDSRTFSAQSMRIVVGSGQVAGQTRVIDDYRNNIAILSSGTVKINTSQFGLLEVMTGGANRNGITFFWRNGARPEDLHSLKISSIGTRWVNLDDISEWTGDVSEIGLIFYSDEARTAEFQQLRLSPHSLLTNIHKLAYDWSETSRWSQKSVHFLPAGSMSSTIRLPILMAAWVVITLVAAFAMTRWTRGSRATILVLCALVAWAVLDIRWTANRLAQAGSTINNYSPITATNLSFGDDSFTRQLIDAARPEIGKADARTVIMAEDGNMRFQMLRAKYHALPAATYVHEGSLDTFPAQIGEYLFVLKKRYFEPGHAAPTATGYARLLHDKTGMRATPLWENEEGFLLEITPATPTGQPGE